MTGSAIISPCGKYRYRLERHGLSGSGAIAWIMVNPSTADAEHNDQTIKKVMGFSERFGAGWLIVGNKFAYRSKDITDLRHAGDPCGADNTMHLKAIMADASRVIVAWGALAKLPPHLRHQWRTVCEIADDLGRELHCLGTAQDGQPLHPCMLGYDRPLIPWKRP